MTDSVIEEAAPPQQDESSETPKSDKEINFGKLRKKLEAVEERNERLEETLSKQSDLLTRFESAFTKPEETYERVDPDDFITGKTLDARDQRILEEADKRADKRFEQRKEKDFLSRLQSKYSDYDEVITAENAKLLEQQDPDFAEALGDIPSEYNRREKAYKRIKKLKKSQVSAQEVADGNIQKNYFYTPQGQQSNTNPYAFEFDVNNKEARTAAYKRLKSAQKRGI